MSEEQIEECGCVNFECRCSVDAIRAQLAAKSAECERLREALEWYQDWSERINGDAPGSSRAGKALAALAPRDEKPAGEGER